MYHKDIKKGLFFIIFFFVVVAISIIVSSLWWKTESQINTPEIIGKINWKATVTCDEDPKSLEKLRKGKGYAYDCHLSNNPRVTFDLNFACKKAVSGNICMIGINEEKKT